MMVNFLMTMSSLEKVWMSPFCARNVPRVIIPESVSNFRYTTSQCVFILSASGQFGI